jgi:hypothetical protein
MLFEVVTSRPGLPGQIVVGKHHGHGADVETVDGVEVEILEAETDGELALPTVSARSERMGPKLWVERLKTPSDESRVKVKPDAGEGRSTAASWEASAVLKGVKLR